jgi:DNA polymerase III sliding clamp (beta) subunit (PCNA family)
MTAREITGAFPNWEMVLPKNFDYFAELNVKDLRDALTRVGVMADDSHRRVEFISSSDKVLLKTESAESGSSAEEVSCVFQKFSQSEFQNETGNSQNRDAWKIAFNAKYLNYFFTNQAERRDEQKVIWKFTAESSQTEVLLEGEEELFSYIVVLLKS